MVNARWNLDGVDVNQPLANGKEQIGKIAFDRLQRALMMPEVDPNHAVHLFAWIRVNFDFPGIQRGVSQSWNLLASSRAIKLPSVIAASDSLTVESSFGKRYTPMRAIVSQRKRSSVRISSEDNLFSKNLFRPKSSLSQFPAIECEVPEVFQEEPVFHIEVIILYGQKNHFFKFAELFRRELLALAMALRKREDQEFDETDRIVTFATVFCNDTVKYPVSDPLPSLPCRPFGPFTVPLIRPPRVAEFPAQTTACRSQFGCDLFPRYS